MNEKIKKYRLELYLKYYKSFTKTDYRILFKLYKKDETLFLKRLETLNNICLEEFYGMNLSYFISHNEIFDKKYDEYKKALLITTILFNFSGFYFEEKQIKKLKKQHKNYKMIKNITLDNDGVDVIFFNNYKEYYYQFKYKNIKESDVEKFISGIKKYQNKSKKTFAFIITKEKSLELKV